jgi:hypothetical protein
MKSQSKILLNFLLPLLLVAATGFAQTLQLAPTGQGAAVTITGSGAPANAPVELFQNGVSVGWTNAGATGFFLFPGVSVTAGDQFEARLAQVWNFNTNGDFESWNGTGEAATVSGGIWTQTEDTNGNMTLNLYGDGLITTEGTIARALEIRLRYTGAGSLVSSLVLQSAGPNGVADGGGDDVSSAILNTTTITQTTDFQTLVFDLGVDHTGVATAWVDGSPPINLQLFMPGTSVGDTIEVDYIRVSESLNWGFDSVGDLQEWIPSTNTNLVTNGGTITMTAIAGGNIGMGRPFRLIDSNHFVTLESRLRQVSGITPNLLDWNYLSNPAGFGSGGHRANTAADGAFETINIDLTQTPFTGNSWQAGGAATLNTPTNESYVGQFANGSGDLTEVDYIALLPSTVYGPSPVITATSDPEEVNFYISSSGGSDSNTGRSEAEAWATFDNINNLELGPGNTLFLRRGDTWANSELILGGKGTSGDPITLTAYGDGPNPIITGVNLIDKACVTINNASYWEIDSLDLRDAKIGLYLRYTGGNLDGTGDMFNNQSVHVTCSNFQNMDEKWSDINGDITVVDPFELAWGAGIWVGGSIPSPPGGPHPSENTLVLNDFSVTHSSFQHCSTGVGSNFYFPPVFKSRLTNFVMEDLWVTGCENGSFALFYTDGGHAHRVDTFLGGDEFYSTGTTGGFLQHSRNFDIDNCEFAYNIRPATSNDGVGFDYEGDCDNMTFTNNVVHNNDGAGLLILDSPPGSDNTNLLMTSNTFWNNCRNPRQDSASQNKALRYPQFGSTGSFANNGVYLGVDVGTGPAAGTLAVYDVTATWNTDFSANTAIPANRTSNNFASVSGRPTQWDWNDNTVQGWGNENQWTGLSASGGTITGTSSGSDPFIESPDTWVNTRDSRMVRVVMSQTAGTSGQIFFQTETDATWTPGKSVGFSIIADGNSHEYIIDMGDSTDYKGVITKFRLDPTDASGSTMVIDSFASHVEPFIKSITAISSNEIDLVFGEPMLPGSGLFNMSNYAISGAGQGSLDTNPDTVTQLCTPSGPVYRLKWDTGISNGSNATITVSNLQDARGNTVGFGNAANVTTIQGAVPMLALNPVNAGTGVSVTGINASVNGPVELFVNGVSQGNTLADGSGNFTFSGIDLVENDELHATASQVWNFNTDADLEGWIVASGSSDNGTVAGGIWTITTDSTGNLTLDLIDGGNPVVFDTNVTRVFEIRFRATGYTPSPPSTVIFNPGSGAQFGPDWNPTSSPNFQTSHVDMTANNVGVSTSFTSTGSSTQLGIGSNGWAAGNTLEVDYIRMTEMYDWEFNFDNDLENFSPLGANASTVVAGGSLTVESNAPGVNPGLAYNIFGGVDTTYFNTLDARVSAATSADPNNIFQWGYLQFPGFTPGGYQATYSDDGMQQDVSINLTTTATFGPNWGDAFATLNNAGGTIQALFAPVANDTATIDYIRLRPSSALGPSATILAGPPLLSVESWEAYEHNQ